MRYNQAHRGLRHKQTSQRRQTIPLPGMPERLQQNQESSNQRWDLETIINMKKPFIPSWIFEQGFPARHVAVLCYVASRGKCLASQATIGKALHIERGDVGKILRDLVAHQWLEVLPFGYTGKWVKCHKLTSKEGIRFDAPKRPLGCSQMATQTNNLSSNSTLTGEEEISKKAKAAEKCSELPKNGSIKVKEVSGHSAAAECAAENAQKGTQEASQRSSSMMTAEKIEASVTGQSVTLKERDKVLAVIFSDFEHMRGKRPASRKAEKWG